MSSQIIGRAVGTSLQPVVVYALGEHIAALMDAPELKQLGACFAVYDSFDPTRTSYSTGLVGCGAELFDPALGVPDRIYVLTAADGGLDAKDAAVLERFLHAKLGEITGWNSRFAAGPSSYFVGEARFADLMAVGSEALRLIKRSSGLFHEVDDRQLSLIPREFEPLIWDRLQYGPPVGEELVLEANGITARGVDMGTRGFVVRAGSEVRSIAVGPEAAPLPSAVEESFFNGLLVRRPDGKMLVRRDLWRSSRIAAAKFVTGSSDMARHWRPVSGPVHLRLV